MAAELFLLCFLLNSVFEQVRSGEILFNVHQYFSFAILNFFEFMRVIFKEKQFPRRLLGSGLRGCIKCITYM